MRWTFMIVALASLATPTFAADKADYQTAKLTDSRREDTGSGAARGQDRFAWLLSWTT
jgi:hypothetical protein